MNTIVGFGASLMQGARDSQGGFLRRLERLLSNREPASSVPAT